MSPVNAIASFGASPSGLLDLAVAVAREGTPPPPEIAVAARGAAPLLGELPADRLRAAEHQHRQQRGPRPVEVHPDVGRPRVPEQPDGRRVHRVGHVRVLRHVFHPGYSLAPVKGNGVPPWRSDHSARSTSA